MYAGATWGQPHTHVLQMTCQGNATTLISSCCTAAVTVFKAEWATAPHPPSIWVSSPCLRAASHKQTLSIRAPLCEVYEECINQRLQGLKCCSLTRVRDKLMSVNSPGIHAVKTTHWCVLYPPCVSPPAALRYVHGPAKQRKTRVSSAPHCLHTPTGFSTYLSWNYRVLWRPPVNLFIQRALNIGFWNSARD